MTPTELNLLRDVLALTVGQDALPEQTKLRSRHEKERKTLDVLEKRRYLFQTAGRCSLTLQGLKACDTPEAEEIFAHCQETLATLQGLHRKQPNTAWTIAKVATSWGILLSPMIVTLLSSGLTNDELFVLGSTAKTGFVSEFRLTEKILDVAPLAWETFNHIADGPETAITAPLRVIHQPHARLKGVRLSKLKLQDFKSIRNVEGLSLRPLNVLIGANGAGKSNLVSFFRFLRAMAEVPGGLQLHTANGGGASTFLFEQAKKTPRLEAELSFTSDHGTYEYRVVLSATATNSFIFTDERYRALSQTPEGWQHGAEVGDQETGLYDAFIRGDPVAKTIFWLLQEIAIYQCNDTSETARIKQKWSVSDDKRLKSDGGNLAPFLLRLKIEQPNTYERITATIRLIAPFFDDFVLEPSGQNFLLRWRERGSEVVFDAHQTSDGTLRAMALVGLLLQPPQDLPALIILDEPELGLHPYAIEVIAGLIKSASAHTQIIIATQSTVLLNQFEPEDVIIVDRLNRETTFTRLNPEALAGRSLAEHWEKHIMGHKNKEG